MDGTRLDELKRLALGLWQAHGAEPPLEGLRMSCATAPSGPFHGVYKPSLCVVLQGAKVSRLGAQDFRYEAGQCLIASLEVPIRAEIVTASAERPYLAFALAIDPAQITDLLLAEPRPDGPAALPSAAMAVQDLGPDLPGPLARLLALAGRPRDIAVLGPMLRREIVWHLLNGPHGGALRQIGLADSRMARLGRAIAWIREHFAATLSVPHLATLSGMSPATFHRHFKAATAMTPVQFQKSLRLQEARRLLLAEGSDVARVGFAIGYESPSQFSREYRRLFGRPPGRDGALIRQGAGGGPGI